MLVFDRFHTIMMPIIAYVKDIRCRAPAKVEVALYL